MSHRKGESLSKAILIATLAHAGQFDRGGNPYILHALTVLHKVGSDDEDIQCAAVLHDVIEDCSGKTIFIDGTPKVISFEMLREEGMSELVIDTVRRLTKMPGQTYAEYQEAVLGSTHAMTVKKEDLRTNSDLRRLKSKTVTEKDITRTAKYLAFYATIQARLGA